MKDSEARAASGVAAEARRRPRLSRRKTLLAPGCASLAASGVAAFLIFGPLTVGVCSATDAPSEPAKSVALLNVQFLNDHEDLEPTTSAERARIALIASVFKAKLEASGRYYVRLPTCGRRQQNCRRSGGRRLRRLRVWLRQSARRRLPSAWIVVQKVSDLILNINVYMADVAAKKMAFVHSVDIRGDTDESWTRGITYLVKNYLLPAP